MGGLAQYLGEGGARYAVVGGGVVHPGLRDLGEGGAGRVADGQHLPLVADREARVEHTDLPHDVEGVGRLDDADAERVQFVTEFGDLDGVPAPGERDGEGQPADAATVDQDTQRGCHLGFSPGEKTGMG